MVRFDAVDALSGPWYAGLERTLVCGDGIVLANVSPWLVRVRMRSSPHGRDYRDGQELELVAGGDETQAHVVAMLAELCIDDRVRFEGFIERSNHHGLRRLRLQFLQINFSAFSLDGGMGPSAPPWDLAYDENAKARRRKAAQSMSTEEGTADAETAEGPEAGASASPEAEQGEHQTSPDKPR